MAKPPVNAEMLLDFVRAGHAADPVTDFFAHLSAELSLLERDMMRHGVDLRHEWVARNVMSVKLNQPHRPLDLFIEGEDGGITVRDMWASDDSGDRSYDAVSEAHMALDLVIRSVCQTLPPQIMGAVYETAVPHTPATRKALQAAYVEGDREGNMKRYAVILQKPEYHKK